MSKRCGTCGALAYPRSRPPARRPARRFPTATAKGTRARKLASGEKDSDPAWSPDGRGIAFVAKRKDGAEPQVYVIAPDGGEARRVTSIATGAASLKWFADSKRIAFVSWVWPDLSGDAAQGKRLKERKD